MHRNDKSSADYSSLRRINATDKAYASQGQTMHGYNGATAGTTNASRWLIHRNRGATAATVHAPRRQRQCRLCIATANQRQRKRCASCSPPPTSAPTMHRDGAGNTMHRYGGPTTGTERMHRDGESRADYASLRRMHCSATQQRQPLVCCASTLLSRVGARRERH